MLLVRFHGFIDRTLELDERFQPQPHNHCRLALLERILSHTVARAGGPFLGAPWNRIDSSR